MLHNHPTFCDPMHDRPRTARRTIVATLYRSVR